MILAFGDCEIDRELYQLRRRGRVVKLEPKVFDVLAHLAEHRDRVVTKQELLDVLWPGEALSESVLPRAIAAARRAVGDTRAKARVIETVHGRGYRFVAEVKTGGTPAAPPAEPAPSALFVGRERTLARLERALDAALAGRGGLVLLAGEPGIGKTRTAEELARKANERGAQVLLGRCFEGEGAPAFWPWLQVLRGLAAATDPARLRTALGSDAATLAQLVPELGSVRSDAIAAAAGEQARFRLFDALAATLRRRAQQGPLVLVLDDLHWADEASLRALEFLAHELRGAALLVVATFRDVEVRRDHPLARLLGALAREPACERIALRGLEEADVGALVAAVLGAEPPPELARTVHEMTEGNPFFVSELARLLGEGGGADAAPSALALPQSVRDAIGRRLDAVSPACNEVLRTAAVLGRAFDTALLARVAERTPGELLDLVGEALGARVLVEQAGGLGRFAFAHALVRQTLYEELRAPLRVRLHRRAAEALEAVSAAGEEPPLSEIAHHWFEAAVGGGAEEAIAAAVRAAKRAHALLAYEESARLYEQALEALAITAPEDAERRFELLAAAAAEHAAAGARDSARAHYRTAAGIARAQGRTDLLARAAIGYRGFGEMGTPPEPDTLALLEEARDALGARDPVLRSRLLSKLTGTAPYMLSMAKRDELSGEALALARASGDPVALQDALSARYWACLGPDRIAERLAVGEEMVAMGERNHDLLLTFTGHEGLFGVHLLCGDARGAERALAECVRLADALRYRYVLFQARFFQGAHAACTGDFDAAERILADALELGRGRVPFAQVLYDAHSLWLRFQRGDRGALGENAALLEAISGQWKGSELVARAALALIAQIDGRDEDARAHLAAIARDGFGSLERDEHFLLTAAVASDVIVGFQDRALAADLYPILLPYAHLLSLHDLLRTFAGSVSGELGELASVLGRHDAAVAHYEEALAREHAAGARAAEVSSRIGLARALRARRGPGDARRAEALVREAAAAGDALGLRWGERFGFDPVTLRDLKR
ncbi:MAG TPA: AAA family ATPase [Myxococcota bacterium]|nr:AAA family ATPase [Myxococcota bacterium]